APLTDLIIRRLSCTIAVFPDRSANPLLARTQGVPAPLYPLHCLTALFRPYSTSLAPSFISHLPRRTCARPIGGGGGSGGSFPSCAYSPTRGFAYGGTALVTACSTVA